VNLWGRQQRAADLGALAGPPIPPPSAGARWGGRVIVRSSDTALRHAAVWAATRFRSDLLGSLPVDVYKRTASGRPVQIDPPSVLVKPTATDRIDEFLVMGEMSQCLRGNAVGVIVSRDRLQYPTQIELVHPDEWALRRDPLTGAIVEARGELRGGGQEKGGVRVRGRAAGGRAPRTGAPVVPRVATEGAAAGRGGARVCFRGLLVARGGALGDGVGHAPRRRKTRSIAG
jgi:hypothetical protein